MNKDVMEGFVNVWNTGNYDDLNNIVAQNIKRIGPDTTKHSVNSLPELVEVMKSFRTAFPDGKVTLHEDYYLGDQGFCRWTFTGTNTGPGDFPPTGKSVNVPGLSFIKFENGKMTEERLVYDVLGMMIQLGLIELPAAASA